MRPLQPENKVAIAAAATVQLPPDPFATCATLLAKIEEQIQRAEAIRGDASLAEDEWKKAVDLCNNAIEGNKEYWRFYYLKGIAVKEATECQMRRGMDLDEGTQIMIRASKLAIDEFSKCIKLNSNHAPAYVKRARARSQLKSEIEDIAEKNALLKLALKDANEAIRLDSNSWEAYEIRAHLCDYAENYAQAIRDYTDCIRLNPTYAFAYYCRAGTYVSDDQRNRALNDYATAIHLDPKFGGCYCARARLHKIMGNPDQAIADLTRAIDIDAKDRSSLSDRAEIYCELGRFNDAVNDYTEVIRQNPDRYRSYYERGNAYLRSKQCEKAISDFDESISQKGILTRLFAILSF